MTTRNEYTIVCSDELPAGHERVNMQEELITDLNDNGYSEDNIRCAYIYIWVPVPHMIIKIKLKDNHTPAELDEFLNALSMISYDNQTGEMYVTGTVWLNDSTWLTRIMSETYELWTHHSYPTIPEDLQ